MDIDAGRTQKFDCDTSDGSTSRMDAALVRCVVRTGSRRHADRLVRRYYDGVFRFVARQMAGKQEAMDVTQEVFVAALRSLPSFDHRRASFRTWLYRIAANKVIDCLRAQRRAVEMPADGREYDIADPRDEFKELIDRSWDELRVRRALELLLDFDPRTQAVVRLRIFSEAGFSDIAAVTQQSEAAAKAQYYRAVKAIRIRMEREGWRG